MTVRTADQSAHLYRTIDRMTGMLFTHRLLYGDDRSGEWRISPDIIDRMPVPRRPYIGLRPITRIMGMDVIVDDTLPPDAIILR